MPHDCPSTFAPTFWPSMRGFPPVGPRDPVWREPVKRHPLAGDAYVVGPPFSLAAVANGCRLGLASSCLQEAGHAKVGAGWGAEQGTD